MARKWGQHFLIRQGVVERMLKQAQIAAGDEVLEIGPGNGFLTRSLLGRGARVTSVEIDPRLCGELKKNFGNQGAFVLVESDVMQVDPHSLCPENPERSKLVANLPYQIATALLLRLLPFRNCWKSMTLMVQKEVADRICATSAQKKDYGSLSLAAGMAFECRQFLNVPPAAFRPMPKVESSLIFLEPKDSGWNSEEEKQFLKWSQMLFANRRKFLTNSIRRHFPEWFKKDQNLFQQTLKNRRPEELPHQEWFDLFQNYLNFEKSEC
jgi:16S rRNA (adenine1518-N6/adenine1519-N6)-dimethyltransferase